MKALFPLPLNPLTILHFMIDGTIPYDHKQAHDAVITAVGGPEASLKVSCELIEFKFQLEALSLAKNMQQPQTTIESFQASALAALYAALPDQAPA